MSPFTIQVAIIGAGQAGLATAYHLKRLGVQATLIDAHARVGDVWRQRWDSLRLFSPAKYSSLPGWPFPFPPYHLPSKDETADYLEEYARRFGLVTKLGTQIRSLSHDGEHFILETDAEQILAKVVVVATGTFHTPKLPPFAAELQSSIRQLHVADYRNPDDLQAGDALVVGTGASGSQIAAELAKSGRKVYLSGPETPNMPRKKWGKDIYWWLYTTGAMNMRKDSWLGRRYLKKTGGGDALIGRSLAEITKEAGLHRLGMMQGQENGWPKFDDGSTLPDIRNILWATGYQNDYSWIHLPILDQNGEIQQKRGECSTVPGLYFMGLKFMFRADSSNLGGVKRDAEYLAGVILGLVR
jgi:putative flavoprotein involved in K+ transport